jgi:hypothetical protein
MSVNVYLPHVLILPEDEADLEIANGFHQQIDWDRQRQMQVLNEAGGWMVALELFQAEHIHYLQKYPTRFMVLLIDFDAKEGRWGYAQTYIPEHLKDRVFVIGSQKEPEDLKRAKLGSLEKIGAELAEDCRGGTDTTWGHEMLKHNADELARLRELIRPILFSN